MHFTLILFHVLITFLLIYSCCSFLFIDFLTILGVEGSFNGYEIGEKTAPERLEEEKLQAEQLLGETRAARRFRTKS